MPLTWRNVAGPDFRGATQSLSLSADLFDRSLNGARAGLDRVDDRLSANVNNAFQTQLLQYDDPEALQKALMADATLNVGNSQRISANSRNLAEGRIGSLRAQDSDDFDRQVRETAFARDNRNDARSEENRGLLDNAQGDMGHIMDAFLTGDVEAGREIMRTSESFQNLKPGQKANFISQIQGAGSGALGLDRSRYSFDQAVLGNENRQKINEVLQQVSGDFNSNEAIGRVRAMALDPTVERGVLARIESMSFIGDSLGSPDSIGASSGANRGYDTRFGFDRFTAPPKPLTQMTMGEVYDYGQNVLRPETRDAGFGKLGGRTVGTSAVGAYQFVGGTLEKYAKEIFGNDWKNQQFTPEVQDEMARRLWEDSKDGNLKKVWEGLPNSRPGAYADLSWEEMKQQIWQHEIGGAPVSSLERNAVNSALEIGLSNNASDLNSNSVVSAYVDNISFNGSFDDALEAAPEWMKGIERGKLRSAIDRVKTRARSKKSPALNDAQALAILQRSEEQQSFLGDVGDFFNVFGTDNDLGQDTVFSDEKIDAALEQLEQGAIDNNRIARGSLAQTGQNVSAAEGAMLKAQAALQRANEQNLSRTDPETYQRLRRTAIEAEQVWRAVTSEGGREQARYRGGNEETPTVEDELVEEITSGNRNSSRGAVQRSRANQPQRNTETINVPRSVSESIRKQRQRDRMSGMKNNDLAESIRNLGR